MDFTKKNRIAEVLNAVTVQNAIYDAQKILEVTISQTFRSVDPELAELLRQHEESVYKIRAQLIQQITSMPEFKTSAAN